MTNCRTLLFLLSVVLTLPAAAQTYEELVGQSWAAMERDSLEEAQRLTEQALALEPANPRNALLFSNLGTICRRRQQPYPALDYYTLALNLAPANVSILLNRASLYMELGREELARIDYAQVLDLDHENQEARLMRAYIYFRQRNFPASRADYELLLRLAPHHYECRLGLAVLSQAEGKYKESLLLIDAMLAEAAAEPADTTATYSPLQTAELHVARAGVLMEQSLADQALLDLERAIAICPTSAEAFMMRGQIYLTQRKKQLAKINFDQAAALGVPASELREAYLLCK